MSVLRLARDGHAGTTAYLKPSKGLHSTNQTFLSVPTFSTRQLPRESPFSSNYARDSEAPPEREIDDSMVINGPKRLEPEPEPHHFYTKFHPKANYQDIWTGKTFMDLFDEDLYAEYRAANLYYPFASQEEWQLASFLLKSGLSMSAIDEFLKLDLVCVSAASGIILTCLIISL